METGRPTADNLEPEPGGSGPPGCAAGPPSHRPAGPGSLSAAVARSQLHPATVQALHRAGVIHTAAASRLVLCYYLRISGKHGRPCTVSPARIARDLDAPRTTVADALNNWPAVARTGTPGERNREWTLTESTDGNPSPTDGKPVAPQDA